MRSFWAAALIAIACAAISGQPPASAVLPIEPPATPLPAESASAGVTRFSFIAYGDTRSGAVSSGVGDGQVVHPVHNALVDLVLAKAAALSTTPHPIRFVVISGDAVLRGQTAAMWNVSFTPIVNRITRGADIPFFFAAGNHDVSTMPVGSDLRAPGLQNTLAAISRLIPPEGSPRRLPGYPVYAFAYGNLFALALDSNVADDHAQLAWVTDQLEHLDRTRYHHVIAFFHHPFFSAGPHGGSTLEPPSAAMRTLYAPLFRKHHVRMTIAGHDHLLDHWVERYTDKDGNHRRDDVVTGGGGAPIYTYKAEPDLIAYQLAGSADKVRVEHLAKPGPTPDDNPNHFLVVQVDGDHLSLEIVSAGPGRFAPYNGRSTIALDAKTK